MLAASRLNYLLLAYFSRPQSDRTVYRAVRKHGCHRFLEIGVGNGRRAQRLIDVALGRHAKDQIRFVGIDLFESRPRPIAA